VQADAEITVSPFDSRTARDLLVAKPSPVITNTMATGISRAMPDPGAGTLYTLWNQRPLMEKLWILGAATLVLGLAYAPNFRGLIALWGRDPSYSHGFLVIPIALVILWQRLSEPQPDSSSTATVAPWWGWFFLIAFLAIRATAYELNLQWLENATVLPVIVCLTWTFGGWPLLRRAWPAIAFLVFMLPLPQLIDKWLAAPLQKLAATSSCYLLQTSGLWAVQDGGGNVIQLSTGKEGVMVPLDVAIACNGLHMLMTLAATVSATIALIPLPTWKRICLLLSVVPIALFSNMVRIVGTGWCYYLVEGAAAKEWAHDVSGWLMMPLALVLVAIELGILSWLVPKETEDDKPVIPFMYVHKTQSGKKKSGNKDLGDIA
jgi:exosortase